MESLFGQMVQNMLVNFKMINLMAKVTIAGMMGRNITEDGSITKWTVKVHFYGQTSKNMLDNINLI